VTASPVDPRTILIIHHSHTDLGYTEAQGRVERWHGEFIRQALDIIEGPAGRAPDGWKWQCETFWAVERFWETASAGTRAAFIRAVRSGHLGLSGSYLNLSELLDYDLLQAMTKRAADFGKSIGAPVDSAMTADVNGYSWGFSQALHDNAVANLFTCIHTHHGMFPLGRTQVPFWWETPKGDRILVWSGEHYHFGNELGVVPGAVSSYLTKDECDAEMIFSDHWKVAEIRIPRYLERLRQAGYAYPFVPVMASGLRTDNGPPNGAIAEFCARWNRAHADTCLVEMTTLSEFFRLVRSEDVDLPVYRGDWPDWWSDGCAGNPATTRLFRQAQRDLSRYHRLLDRYPQLVREATDSAAYSLVLYAEHTFSHSDAMSQPWHPLVHTIAARKKAFASDAEEAVTRLTDRAVKALGASDLRVGRPVRYRVLNPLSQDLRGVARLPVGHFEYHELTLDRPATVWDVDANRPIASERDFGPGGCDFCVQLELEPGAERTLELRPATGDDEAGSESEPVDSPTVLETPFVRIAWEEPRGIVDWQDRESGATLLRPGHGHSPFVPVYEVTPVADRSQICSVRGAMGLNRKGPDVERSVGRLVHGRLVSRGPVFTTAELRYEVPGLSLYDVVVRALVEVPQVDVSIRIHKASVWEPENLYIALPFGGASPSQVWLDKAGALVRPFVDQLPGTLTDFSSVQAGAVITTSDGGIAVATPDTNLIQLGPLSHGPRRLAGAPELEDAYPELYAWVMTNYWETNFAANLGGFYEFRYAITWGPELSDEGRAAEACRAMSMEPVVFRLGPAEA
jgi:hypothetical protein